MSFFVSTLSRISANIAEKAVIKEDTIVPISFLKIAQKAVAIEAPAVKIILRISKTFLLFLATQDKCVEFYESKLSNHKFY